jgi:hypothetical protein
MIGKLNVGPKATIAPITWRNRKIAIQMVIDALTAAARPRRARSTGA